MTNPKPRFIDYLHILSPHRDREKQERILDEIREARKGAGTMKTTLVTTDGFKTIREVGPDEGYDLPVLCLEEERRRQDSFCVLAMRDGRVIADAEGWAEPEAPDPFDIACERRWD